MYKSLKLNQRNIFDLIPGMTVIFSDDDFTTTAHSEAAYLAWIRAMCYSILSTELSYIERVPSKNHSTDDIPHIGHSIG